ncbi:hypothetical protein Ciccas_014339 [Cichlidogyrus casuarinus]|uniref:Uncharacterized protein n=1 Tax=Cichlidogyrus casuarinus TaxID=1844966 RepID=A0ABD2PII3_9PLAT
MDEKSWSDCTCAEGQKISCGEDYIFLEDQATIRRMRIGSQTLDHHEERTSSRQKCYRITNKPTSKQPIPRNIDTLPRTRAGTRHGNLLLFDAPPDAPSSIE